MRMWTAVATAAAMVAALPTSAQVFGTNLVVNGGAEASPGGGGEATGAPGFTTTAGGLAVVSYATGGGYPGPGSLGVGPANGANFFAGSSQAFTSATQRIGLAGGASTIDMGGTTYDLSALLGGFASQDDFATVTIAFLSGMEATLGTGGLSGVSAADRGNETGFLLRSSTGAVPIGTRFVDVTMSFTRTAGSANDGYLDNLSLVLSPGIGGAVPEPATWALMILGFGAVGGAMRRRSLRLAAA